MLPAARFFDAGAPPQASGAVKIEKPATAAARGLFQKQVSIQEHRLNAREQGITAIQMAPPRLDHTHLGVGEKMDGPLQQIWLRHEIGVENADQFPFRRLQSDSE